MTNETSNDTTPQGLYAELDELGVQVWLTLHLEDRLEAHRDGPHEALARRAVNVARQGRLVAAGALMLAADTL